MSGALTCIKDKAEKIKQEIEIRKVVKIRSTKDFVGGAELEVYVYSSNDVAEEHVENMEANGWIVNESEKYMYIFHSYTDIEFSKSTLVPVRTFVKRMSSCFICEDGR